MDYKVNILNRELETQEGPFSEIQGLHFAMLNDRQALFDYNQYFIDLEINPIDFKIFLRLNKHFIENLIKANGLKTSEIVYQNTNGHILMDSQLLFLFVAFANPDMLIYFNSLLIDIINDGVGYSNSFVMNIASDRLPTKVLNEIIKERENATGDE